MADQHPNDVLNQILVNLTRSLLQYVGECWPWTGVEEQHEREQIESLVDRQKTQIARLADLLWRREWNLDFGSYPIEYTDLHYVALDYLLSQLIENEEALLADIQQARQECSDDAEAVAVLDAIRDSEQETLKQLRELAGSPNLAAGSA